MQKIIYVLVKSENESGSTNPILALPKRAFTNVEGVREVLSKHAEEHGFSTEVLLDVEGCEITDEWRLYWIPLSVIGSPSSHEVSVFIADNWDGDQECLLAVANDEFGKKETASEVTNQYIQSLLMNDINFKVKKAKEEGEMLSKSENAILEDKENNKTYKWIRLPYHDIQGIGSEEEDMTLDEVKEFIIETSINLFGDYVTEVAEAIAQEVLDEYHEAEDDNIQKAVAYVILDQFGALI